MRKLVVLAALTVAATALAGSASANHSWGKYHWARTANPFSLVLGSNTTSPIVPSPVSTGYAPYTHTCRGTGHLDSFNSAGAAGSYFPGAKASFAPGTRVAKDEYVDHLPDGGLLVTFVTPATR